MLALFLRLLLEPLRSHVRLQQGPPTTCATPDLILKYPDATVPTYTATLAKTLENHCKHMQHLDENTCNKRMKHLKYLKHILGTCMYMQHLDLLLQHPDENTYNIRLI